MAVKKPLKGKRLKKGTAGGNYTEGIDQFPQLRPKTAILYEDYTPEWPDLVTQTDRLREISLSKWIFRNVPPITGAVLDIGNYAVGNAWRPISYAKDRDWAKQASAWLENWFKIGNVVGNGFDLWEDLKIASYDLDVKGDTLLYLTYAADGEYPLWGWVSSEQIGNRDKQTEITRGPFTGYPVEHGCVTNGVRVVAYQILGSTEEEDVVVDAENALLLFEPRDSRQMRGEPSMVPSLNTIRDYRTWMDFEREKAKILASQVMSIDTVEGEANQDPSAVLVDSSATSRGADGVYGRYIRGSNIQIFKAGAGEKINAIEHSNPSTNAQEFMNRILRDAFAGLEWPIEMIDITSLRSGPVRFIKEKVMKKVLKRQETLSAAYLRILRYGISKAIKLGLLPDNEDFLLWGYQLPAEITIDSGRDSAASLNEIAAYAKTRRAHFGEKGEDWREEIEQAAYEEAYILAAKQQAKERVQNEIGIMLEDTREESPSSTATQPASPVSESDDMEEEDEEDEAEDMEEGK